MSEEKENSLVCPECGSNQTEGKSFDIEVIEGEEWVMQYRSCLECEAEWAAWFKFTNNIIVEHGKQVAHTAATELF